MKSWFILQNPGKTRLEESSSLEGRDEDGTEDKSLSMLPIPRVLVARLMSPKHSCPGRILEESFSRNVRAPGKIPLDINMWFPQERTARMLPNYPTAKPSSWQGQSHREDLQLASLPLNTKAEAMIVIYLRKSSNMISIQNKEKKET